MLREGFSFLTGLPDVGKGFGCVVHGLVETVIAVVYQPHRIGQSAMFLRQLAGVLNMLCEGFPFLAILLDSRKGFGVIMLELGETTVAVGD